MAKEKKKLMILDGNSLLHRAWHALPPLTTKDGTVVNAAYGFSMGVDKILKEFKPHYFAVAWDLPGKTFRHKAVESYKANRTKQPQELYDQIPICKDILEAYGIPSLEAEGFEGDDIIGTISNMEEQQDFDTLIVTGDLDALQLVDENTHVVFFVKGISQTKIYDIDAVKERYGFGPEKLIDFKAMKGDSSDNIAGVPGVGDKTGAGLIDTFGTLEEMYKDLKMENGKWKKEGVKEKLRDKLLAHEEDALESKMLVTIIRDVDLNFKISDAELPEPNKDKLLELFRAYEFRTLIRKMSEVAPPPYEGKEEENGKLKIENRNKKEKRKMKVSHLHSPDELPSFKDKPVAVFALEQAPDLFGNTLAGIALADGKKQYLILNPDEKMLGKITGILGEAKNLYVHGYKSLLHLLELEENLETPVFDTMLASYLLNPGSRAHDFPTAASDTLGEALEELPESLATDNEQKIFVKAVSLLPDVARALESQLKEEGADKIYNELEVPLISILYRMEQEGILLDSKFLAELSKKFEKDIDSLVKKIHKLAGEEFNTNSPSQLAHILFDVLELPTKGIKKTKTGLSTAASELDKLEDAHEIIPLIKSYREVAKLKSTYVDALPLLADSEGRVHTDFNQAVTSTGRLSSSDPNLQNIPIRTELGKEIRKAFVAPKGKTLIAADYSQIELRMAAIIAKDKPFLNAFKEGVDIHTRTAAEIMGVAEDEVSKDDRRAAKAINFGILYGMGPRSLARQTGKTFSEAKEFIAKYFEVHAAIRQYIDEIKIKVRQDGYVETLSGRRRYMPEIESGVPMLVAAAERMAVNMPIQGTAADVLKKAMIEMDEWLSSEYPGGEVKMLLQVHDELVFEVDSKLVEKVAPKIRSIMETAANYEIPLKVDVASGENWGTMKVIV